MARWSTISGPQNAFPLQVTLEVIPGFTVTRHFGNGPVLALASLTFFNPGAFVRFAGIRLRKDGVLQNPAVPETDVTIGNSIMATPHWFLLPDPGEHTFELTVIGLVANEPEVMQQRSSFTIIELPDWDDTNDRVDLFP